MAELADDLVERLRQILAERPTTESELRSLDERVHGLAAELDETLSAAEAHLDSLSADPESSLAETAAELRRVEELKAGSERVSALLENLDERARELRTRWLLGSG